MRRRRLGPHFGRIHNHYWHHWHVFFERRSKFRPWRVIDVQDGPDLEESMIGFAEIWKEILMKKIDVSKVRQVSQYLVDPSGFDKFPQLLGHFNDGLYIGGEQPEVREPGTLFLMPRNGVFLAILKEPSQGLKLVVEVPSLKALWATLEAALGSEGSMWEVDPYAIKKRPKRK